MCPLPREGEQLKKSQGWREQEAGWEGRKAEEISPKSRQALLRFGAGEMLTENLLCAKSFHRHSLLFNSPEQPDKVSALIILFHR
jgi:hypothetical protein